MGVTHFWFFITAIAIIDCASFRSYDVDSVLKRVPENGRFSLKMISCVIINSLNNYSYALQRGNLF